MIKHSSKFKNIKLEIENLDQKTQCIKTYTIVVCGDNEVGKKALIARFLDAYSQIGQIASPRDLVGGAYMQMVIIAGQPCYLKVEQCVLNDTNENKTLFQRADAFIIIYSVDSIISYTVAPYFYDEIISVFRSKFVPIILVANKIDIPDNLRRINKDEGEEISQNYDIPFIETSAKLGTNVELPFYYLVQVLRGKLSPYCARTSSKKNRCNVM